MWQSWRVGNASGSVSVDPDTLALAAEFGRNLWRTAGGDEKEIAIVSAGATTALPLAAAQEKRVSPYRIGTGSGFRIDLAGLGGSDVRLVLVVVLDNRRPEVTCRLAAQEGAAKVRALRWPGAMVPPEDRTGQTTVVPLKQGLLLPGDWPKEFRYVHDINGGGGMYMPWWGQHRASGGYLAAVDTPADASVVLVHPAGGPTAVGVQWDASLGSFSYPRRIVYQFLSPCDFVALAKAYRARVRAQGRFVSLVEKIARTPILSDVIGCPEVHVGILHHVQPESRYYEPGDPAANHRCVTFAARGEQFRRLKARGVGRAYVHLDGWGVRGYDNLHPDCLPPCEEAGGWEGLRGLGRTCRELSWRLVLHDQYRDYYLDAPSFDRRHSILDAEGRNPEWAVWFGGRQSVLCAALACDYVRRNYDDIAAHGVALDGAYLDVFASVDLDECFHPEHPMTRAQCAEHRRRCFGLLRSRGLIVSSEEPMDFASGDIDLVHWGPYPTHPDLHGRGAALGIPVPLLNLVYHDSVIVPWVPTNGPGSWGPETDDPAAHAALCGAMPFLDVEADDAELARCLDLCRLHRKVATLELVAHEFLDPPEAGEPGAPRRRRSVFADGTAVEADLSSGRWTCPDLPADPWGP